MSDLKR
jgi:hypothetical protein